MKKFQLAGALVGAVALVGLASSPALAGTDVTVYGPSLKQGCSYASAAHFASYGEVFTVYDKCADGWAAVVKVDVAPYQSGGGYDFYIWNPNSADGSPVTVNKSYAEGTGVCMQAGSGEYSSGEWGAWGYWSCGTA
ncbi:hypothetical protein [Streptomyces regalis]|uniref:Spore-associated protein A n=1 Tax=Streptomyces regalis TaxID=68262 RepID=A0A124G8K1_9ACTN|nr:hypothetical protein [Streptomyces regalis]KUL26137.1 hypothetical protein ADL12_33670 [Streptomyces regalis]